MSIGLEELVRYWRGELDSEGEERVEEALFEDASVARRLEAIANLEDGLRMLVARGGVQAVMSAGAVEGLAAAGLELRSYTIEPSQVVPCSIAAEDLVVVRLRGEWPAGTVDVEMSGTLEGGGTVQERYVDVPVDRDAGEIVLVFPGDRIRALPKSEFTYRVDVEGRAHGEYGMDHTPAQG